MYFVYTRRRARHRLSIHILSHALHVRQACQTGDPQAAFGPIAARSDRNEPCVIKNDIKPNVVSTINQVLIEICRNFLNFTNK